MFVGTNFVRNKFSQFSHYSMECIFDGVFVYSCVCLCVCVFVYIMYTHVVVCLYVHSLGMLIYTCTHIDLITGAAAGMGR